MVPEVHAGDVLVFTDTMIHGTLPWQADHPRRALVFKFMPYHVPS